MSRSRGFDAELGDFESTILIEYYLLVDIEYWSIAYWFEFPPTEVR